MIALLVAVGLVAGLAVLAMPKADPARERLSRMLEQANPSDRDIRAWNDPETTYAVHGHLARRGRAAIRTEADREDHDSDWRIARWNRCRPPPMALTSRRD